MRLIKMLLECIDWCNSRDGTAEIDNEVLAQIEKIIRRLLAEARKKNKRNIVR